MNYRKLLCGLLVLALAVPQAVAARRKALSADELMTQAREAFYAYNPELAAEKIAALRKLRRGVDVDAVDALEERVNRMDEMIQRVEDIRVIDSLAVSREEFFRNYRLSPAAGMLLPVNELSKGMPAADSTVVYLSESETSIMWGGPKGLMESRRLTDGSWDNPEFLGEDLNAGGIANFPFLMPDGVTLYYATDGDDSLGGLDLYISRRNRDGFPAPQNLGMPYNSPFDDYMLAIDEETGAGWWASDRNSLGDSVTVYIFIPSDSRVNIDVDAEDLADRARLANLAGRMDIPERDALLAKIAAINPSGSRIDDTPDFTFALPSGKVYTRWDDFKSPQARRLMENYVDALADFNADEEELAALRAKFRKGDSRAASAILALEKKLRAARSSLKRLSNQVISAESK